MPIQKRTIAKNPETYRELFELTESRGGVTNVEMWQLRDIHGAGKLGIHVTRNISDKLGSLGLGHYPKELPQHQYDEVRIYVRGSAVGKLINAALTIDVPSNRLLREAANKEDSKTVERIRELVCD